MQAQSVSGNGGPTYREEKDAAQSYQRFAPLARSSERGNAACCSENLAKLRPVLESPALGRVHRGAEAVKFEQGKGRTVLFHFVLQGLGQSRPSARALLTAAGQP